MADWSASTVQAWLVSARVAWLIGPSARQASASRPRNWERVMAYLRRMSVGDGFGRNGHAELPAGEMIEDRRVAGLGGDVLGWKPAVARSTCK
ncbi:MAG: hypothetical protein M0Z66_11240 [Thermaerobacter sp.]|nr:hypothetical protein [Thermaerobacter sp.]